MILCRQLTGYPWEDPRLDMTQDILLFFYLKLAEATSVTHTKTAEY